MFSTNLICVLLLFFRIISSAVANHGHGHHLLHHGVRAQVSSSSLTATIDATPLRSSSPSLSDAEQTVQRALEALSVVNKLRMLNIQFNKYEFQAGKESVAHDLAPPIDIHADTADLASKQMRKRQDQSTGNTTYSFTYSIPDELREAARIVAESKPPATPQGDHERVAQEVRSKYALKTNDTNSPPQKYKKPNGLYEYVPGWEERGVMVAMNGSGISLSSTTTTSSSTAKTDLPMQSAPVKRGTEAYWMVTMPQRGKSPFAPEGYKVWRNVMDYGAKGDGVTDDTAAINRAISDGGRCGANCGSSTIYPAVVYFPPGTYLVSSSIIQYYNTQFLGDPLKVPTILAASSFVGLGVITSDVYISDNDEWYINQNNFLRSVRNFKIDVRLTNPNAYVCAIHWQVAQGTSLENIEFYMMSGTTQQGIYMENGSGGFLSDLTFVGGNFGAFFGNQQFTSSHLVFVNCDTALQIHWDWAWTMQDVIIESCKKGIIIVGGAGGPMSDGQPVGSLILTDTLIANTPTGIITSLYAENSTALLVQNTGFFNVKDAIVDSVIPKTLVAGGNQVFIDNWGFGMLSTKSGNSSFVNGQNIIAMNRTESLLAESGYVNRNFFTRRRPKYYDVGTAQILDVKAMGAKGDGITDDGPVLNSILQTAANLSSVVYFPYGVYVIKDTLKVPVGSRIIGQAWSQIMATGSKFQNEIEPRVAVKVGDVGDVGIVEIQDMLFTVSGNTEGAIVVQWNVHESTKGSAGLWDSHIRVGGAIGSNLQRENCPKKTGAVNQNCKAASLLLHLTPQSSAYLENVWVWVADHDLDVVTQDQIDIYVARGVLIESQGPTWLYGTASEHCVMYQYQLSGAKNVLLGMIQTESPYYQPVPKAPYPFTPGLFPNDPTFDDCPGDSILCAFSWAVRIIDSETIYMLGAGLYSWFSDYSQTCLDTESCQQKGFEIEQSKDIWIYNLCTKAVVEMVTPVGELLTLAKDNRNGFLSSILAWVRTSSEITIGERNFTGFQLYKPESSMLANLTATCKTALTQSIKCHKMLSQWQRPAYHGLLESTHLTDEVCDKGCGRSLKNWYDSVSRVCVGQNITSPGGQGLPVRLGGTVWAGYNETCLKDPETDAYCDEVIDTFTDVDFYYEMPKSELCSYCNIEKYRLMQSSPYSVYNSGLNPIYKETLEHIYATCPGESGPTEIHAPVITEENEPNLCFTEAKYTTKAGDTCDSIAQSHSVASASLVNFNPNFLYNCTDITPGLELCLPLTCDTLYILQESDTCRSIEREQGLQVGAVRKYNPWVNYWCDNLQSTTWTNGHTICLTPQAGYFNVTDPIPGVVIAPGESTGYTSAAVPPPKDATVAEGTTEYCGRWYKVTSAEDSCVNICTTNGITIGLFREVNPSIAGTGSGDCTGLLKVGLTYCVGPIYTWDSITTTGNATV